MCQQQLKTLVDNRIVYRTRVNVMPTLKLNRNFIIHLPVVNENKKVNGRHYFVVTHTGLFRCS